MRNGHRRYLRREAFMLLRKQRHTRSSIAPLLGIPPDNASRILGWLWANGYITRRGAGNTVSYDVAPGKRPPRSQAGKHPNTRANLVTYEYGNGLRAIFKMRGIQPKPAPATLLEQCWPAIPCQGLTGAAAQYRLDTQRGEVCPEFNDAAD